MGRYVLTPAVFDRIAALQPGAGGELQLTDAMLGLCQIEPFHGLVFDGGRFDTGNKLDWLRATVEVALQHEELGRASRRPGRDRPPGVASAEPRQAGRPRRRPWPEPPARTKPARPHADGTDPRSPALPSAA
jgi:hypothetical protein